MTALALALTLAAAPPRFSVLHDVKDVLALPALHARGTHVVHFWASWCEPCLDELPAFMARAHALAAQGVDFTFISADDPETVEIAGASAMAEVDGFFAGAHHYVLGDAIDPAKLTRRLSPRWTSASIPATFIFRDGKRVAELHGDAEDHALDHVLPTSPAGRSPARAPGPSR